MGGDPCTHLLKLYLGDNIMTLQDLIASIQAAATSGVTVNINVQGGAGLSTPIDDIDNDIDDDDLDTDFDIGDRVLVCHIRHDGTRVHTNGTVDSIGTDDKGPYVRVTGDNGKHYRCGLHYDEERLGSMIVTVE